MVKWLLLLLISPMAWGMELYTWKPHENRPRFVIAVREGETPQEAAEKFLQGLVRGPRYSHLGELFARSPLPKMPLRNFQRLDDSDFRSRVLLVANRPEDLSANDWRVPTFADPAEESSMPPYLVSFAADAAFTDAESQQFVRMLNQKFPRALGMGGDDVSGEPFGDDNQGSLNFNADRDAFEIAFFTEKIRTILGPDPGDHRIWATCRALQLIGRILGQKIHPHIDGHGGIGEGAAKFRRTQIEPKHMIHLLPTAHSILLRIAGVSEFMGNSYHHKFSERVADGYLQEAAQSPDGIPEAYESRDGRILLLQFHAELMAVRSQGAIRAMGHRIVRGAFQFLRQGPPTCESQLTSFSISP